MKSNNRYVQVSKVYLPEDDLDAGLLDGPKSLEKENQEEETIAEFGLNRKDAAKLFGKDSGQNHISKNIINASLNSNLKEYHRRSYIEHRVSNQ